MFPENDYRSYLVHHGIKGQRWGIRNGPPYPLGFLDHSPAERFHIGAEKSTKSNSSKVNDYDHSESDNSPLKTYLLSVGLNLAILNGPGLVMDTIRLGQAINSKSRTKKVEAIRANSRIDKKTGLHIKEYEMTKKEDMKMVNPSFGNFDNNTKNNCMLCTTAYDMRRRGYEVSAKKASSGYEMSDAKRWYKGAKLVTTVETPKELKTFSDRWNYGKAASGGNKELTNKVVSELLKQGDGARGNLMMTWDIYGNGHSVIYEVEDGKVILRDCQSNTTYKNPKALLGYSVGASYVRLDNVQPDYKRIKEAVR